MEKLDWNQLQKIEDEMMSSQAQLNGVLTALVTPMNADGSIDFGWVGLFRLGMHQHHAGEGSPEAVVRKGNHLFQVLHRIGCIDVDLGQHSTKCFVCKRILPFLRRRVGYTMFGSTSDSNSCKLFQAASMGVPPHSGCMTRMPLRPM